MPAAALGIEEGLAGEDGVDADTAGGVGSGGGSGSGEG